MSSDYCARSDIEATFGVTNVEKWAKLESDYSASQITARITRAIEVASDEIDDVLRFAGFEIPCTDPNDNTPSSIAQICADMAGGWLYQSRGVDDVDRSGNPRHKLSYHIDAARARLQAIADRRIKINVNTNTG